MSHTKEPWGVKNKIEIVGGQMLRRLIAIVVPKCSYKKRTAEDYTNAARIVACVNACANLPEPEKNIRELVAWTRCAIDAFGPVMENNRAGKEIIRELKKALAPFKEKK